MKKTILILSMCAATILCAQKKSESTGLNTGELYVIQSKSSFVNIKIDKDDAESVKAYLLKTIPELSYMYSGIKLTFETTSPAGKHFTYQQLYRNIPVFGTELKVNVDQEKNIRVLINEAVNLSFIQQKAIDKQVSKLSQKGFCSKHIRPMYNFNVDIKNELNICLQEEKKAVAVQKAEVLNRENHLSVIALLDESGKVIYQRDQRKFHHAHTGYNRQDPPYKATPFSAAPLADTLITVKIFNPNPIVSEHQTYSGSFVDNNDADNAALTAARKTAQVKAKLNAGMYSLENAYVVIKDFSAPNHTPISQASSTFDFTRNNDNFEDVNVFYHVSTMQTYLHSLGFTNLMNGPTKVDSHGTTQDNSWFDPSSEELTIGDGCVDDGEDADVIVHEFGHGVSHFANHNNFSSGDRGALDEAFGDYQACTYHRAIDPYKWEWVFGWDGHNTDCWDGRIANSTKVYPGGLVHEVHADGEIWNSAMMEIWTALGKTTTDKLQYTSLYNWTSNMSMPTAAQLVIQADNQLYAGVNYPTLCTIFKKYGLYSGNCTTGLEEKLPLFSNVMLMPNPAKNDVILKLYLPVNETIQMHVVNMLGEVVYSTRLNTINGENQITFNSSKWATGMYNVVLSSAKENKTLKLLIE